MEFFHFENVMHSKLGGLDCNEIPGWRKCFQEKLKKKHYR